MADKAQTPEVSSADEATPTPPKRSPGHRGTDVRDAVAEMTARAHEISLEAGSKMASALKDVVNAAAGLAGFAIESARDLVQYMVRRGQMTQDEADKLLRDAEEASARRKGAAVPSATQASGEREAAAAKLEPRLKLATTPGADGSGTLGSAPASTPASAPSAGGAGAAARKTPVRVPTVESAPRASAARESAPREAVTKSGKHAAVKPPAKAAKPASKSAAAKKSAGGSKAAARAPAKAQSKKPTGKKK